MGKSCLGYDLSDLYLGLLLGGGVGFDFEAGFVDCFDCLREWFV